MQDSRSALEWGVICEKLSRNSANRGVSLQTPFVVNPYKSRVSDGIRTRDGPEPQLRGRNSPSLLKNARFPGDFDGFRGIRSTP